MVSGCVVFAISFFFNHYLVNDQFFYETPK